MTASVSVLIPCRNGTPHVGGAVASAAGQAGNFELEVLVADDSSTDTSAVVAAAAGATVIGGGGGVVATRNLLVERAGGDWVQFLDADDELEPGKIAAQLAAGQPSYTDTGTIHLDGSRTSRTLTGVDLVQFLQIPRARLHIGAFLVPRRVVPAFDPAWERAGSAAKWIIDLLRADVLPVHVPMVGYWWRRAWSRHQRTARRDLQLEADVRLHMLARRLPGRTTAVPVVSPPVRGS